MLGEPGLLVVEDRLEAVEAVDVLAEQRVPDGHQPGVFDQLAFLDEVLFDDRAQDRLVFQPLRKEVLFESAHEDAELDVAHVVHDDRDGVFEGVAQEEEGGRHDVVFLAHEHEGVLDRSSLPLVDLEVVREESDHFLFVWACAFVECEEDWEFVQQHVPEDDVVWVAGQRGLPRLLVLDERDLLHVRLELHAVVEPERHAVAPEAVPVHELRRGLQVCRKADVKEAFGLLRMHRPDDFLGPQEPALLAAAGLLVREVEHLQVRHEERAEGVLVPAVVEDVFEHAQQLDQRGAVQRRDAQQVVLGHLPHLLQVGHARVHRTLEVEVRLALFFDPVREVLVACEEGSLRRAVSVELDEALEDPAGRADVVHLHQRVDKGGVDVAVPLCVTRSYSSAGRS